MAPSERPKTVLFVDDETSVRLTFAAILRQNGFEVTVAATVAEALREINTQYFDALISDLNIGEPGDGFTVVSAMRRTQPTCTNLILTGYPAFETALQAIRNQVDDYLVKPANIEVSCLSWKWRKRSSVKIAERTYEEGTETFHPRRKSSHPEAASCGQSASLGAV